MSKVICCIGIILNTLGTLFTLWTIFATDPAYVGTALEHDNRWKESPKEKRRVIFGFVVIAIGNTFQIFSLFL